jgi:HD-GYP domain-containing protein (c-di-GMP phosphodiesterase class II)
MLKEIDVSKVRIGMYVILPLSWFEHKFVSNRIKLLYPQQLDDIRSLGVKTVTIDTSKGEDVEEENDEQALLDSFQRKFMEDIIPPALMEAIDDKALPAQQKAELVHQQSALMMKSLLDNPTVHNIVEAKKGITQVVGIVLKDDATTQQLLRITSHDYYTFSHSVTVGILSIALAKVLFKDAYGHNINELGAGFFLHDVGKIQIDQAILNKPSRLTEEEIQQVQRHPNLGFNILNKAGQLSEEAKVIVLQHHERHDGSGYPKHLRGDTIHIYAQICALADIYDALTSDRPYRKALSPFNALKLMEQETVGHFRPDLFKEFVLLF